MSGRRIIWSWSIWHGRQVSFAPCPAHEAALRDCPGFCRTASMMLPYEPFAQIDALDATIQDELIRMWNETDVTIFMVTPMRTRPFCVPTAQAHERRSVCREKGGDSH